MPHRHSGVHMLTLKLMDVGKIVCCLTFTLKLYWHVTHFNTRRNEYIVWVTGSIISDFLVLWICIPVTINIIMLILCWHCHAVILVLSPCHSTTWCIILLSYLHLLCLYAIMWWDYYKTGLRQAKMVLIWSTRFWCCCSGLSWPWWNGLLRSLIYNKKLS